eukprot:13696264-Alexandrium_andersonii.AAC.1
MWPANRHFDVVAYEVHCRRHCDLSGPWSPHLAANTNTWGGTTIEDMCVRRGTSNSQFRFEALWQVSDVIVWSSGRLREP